MYIVIKIKKSVEEKGKVRARIEMYPLDQISLQSTHESLYIYSVTSNECLLSENVNDIISIDVLVDTQHSVSAILDNTDME